LAKVRGFLRVTLAKVGGKRAPNELGVFGLGMSVCRDCMKKPPGINRGASRRHHEGQGDWSLGLAFTFKDNFNLELGDLSRSSPPTLCSGLRAGVCEFGSYECS
jgi:hypothetical protein